MDGTEISLEEALKVIEKLIGKTVKVTVWYGGVLNLEFGEIKNELVTTPGGKKFTHPSGEYSVSIDGNWVLSKKEGQLFGSEYLDFKDAEKYNTFIGETKILGIDIVEKTKVFSFVLEDNKEIQITGSDQESNRYFYLSSRDEAEDGLELTSDFKFKKIPRN